MKVLLTALQPGGGIRTFFRYVYSQACFDDVRITLIAPASGLGDYLGKHIPPERFRVIDIEASSFALLKAVRRELADYDYQLVHSHGFSAGATTEIARLGRFIPHLMTAHDVFRPEQFSGIKGRSLQWLLAGVFRRVDRIHAVTESAGENFAQFMPWVRKERVTTILHGIDSEFFRAGQGQDLRRQIGIPESAPLVGFFGRFMAQKGFRTLVDAIELLKEGVEPSRVPRVLTFGWGGFIREDYQYLQERGLGQLFHQLPATDQMPDMLKSVDMVAMPSRWEACGLLGMEALCAGTPLIGTSCVGLRDVLDGTPALMIEPQSPVALAEAIRRLAENPMESSFAQYQPTACSRFGIARPANALRSLYSELALDVQSNRVGMGSRENNV